MADEGKLREQYERGEQAKRLKENPLIKEFFEEYEKSVWATFKSSNIEDDKGQKNCRLHMKVLEDFKSHFETLIGNGDYAGKQLVEMGKTGFFRR